MAEQLTGRIVVVTGAQGHLGKAVSTHLRDAGAVVVAIDAMAMQAAPDPAGLALGEVDLTDAAAVSRAFATIAERFHALDGVVNVAGGFRWETVADGSVETWDLMYAINVKTALNVVRAALPLLTGADPSIVNVGAAASRLAAAGMGAYAASKSAVARLTEALADEHKARGVRVNAVLPTIIDTPANRADMPDADVSTWVAAEDLSEVIGFLLSPLSRAVTGASIVVGGRG